MSLHVTQLFVRIMLADICIFPAYYRLSIISDHRVVDVSRHYEFGTSSSRGSADSYPSAADYPPQPSHALFRSSSDLQLDANSTANDHSLRREFGSADVLEAQQGQPSLP